MSKKRDRGVGIMLTIEQILENNSINEGVGIIVANLEQYGNLMTLLHNQKYRWKSGNSLTAIPSDLKHCFEEDKKNCALVIFFHSKTRQVCQGDIEDEEIRKILFIKNAKDKYYILKPYILLDKEIREIEDIF